MQRDIEHWEYAAQGHASRVAALALVLWDYLLTFEDERELFWNKPFSVATFLFIWSRYIGLIVSIFGMTVATSLPVTSNSKTGSNWFRIEGWLGLTSAWSVEVILQLHIYALYDRSRSIAITMGLAFLIQVIALVSILLVGTLPIKVVAETFQNISNCHAFNVPNWIWSFWVVLLVFECFLCYLAISKVYERTKPQSPYVRDSLRDVLLRDSALYYISIAVIYSINLFFWIRNLPDSLDLMTGLAVAVPCVMGSRLMINVRSAHYRNELLSQLSPSDISLHFPEITDTPSESLDLPLQTSPPVVSSL